ncbi:DUF2383 domain-containing protein [Salinimicrobium sp. TH3]|uniref:DUF2383 domain-containing protein n=1 Tax=Salinimicrobium sp. TH3 TaxID=2997342 RepID=UPI0022742594|nr:DUF2383 domain-containing protein [Salinimicrobium sp. TH3]MCY2687828.1 DUF2383 domain-containing protein [Salinimicrobium sp. TH3]
MEDRYSKFKKLNSLLIESFEAERIYYNASEDVQQVELKRFFNHETVNRNRFSYEISEQLVQADVEPAREWVQKGNLDRDWREERKALVKAKPLKLLKKCRKKDEENLELYNEIIENKALPKEILKILKKQKETIESAVQKCLKYESGEEALDPSNRPRVRKLKAM